MAGVNANFSFGLSATTGTSAQSKSYAYDEAQYQHVQNVPLSLGARYGVGTATGAAVIGTASQYFVSPHAKQLRSITAVPVASGTAVLAAVGDFFQIYLISMYAQVFGTATGPSYFVGSNTSGTSYGSSTNTGTSANVVQIFNVMTFMTGQSGAVLGTGSFNAGTSAPTPQTVQLAGGTFTVIVSNGVATTTQGGYVFPVGPNGGLSIQPGDVLVVTKGTDTVLQYAGELELTFTPGGLVTR